MTITFGSVCSGIEAASVAWSPLGWKADWLSEIEPFPSALLTHHYPDVPNLGDMTTLPARILSGEVTAPDILCGGTPCQAFSVAGKRRSLDDARGNLSLTFCEIANAIDSVRSVFEAQPCAVFWENVPGVLSTKDNAFGCFLAGLAGEDEPLVPAGGKWPNAGLVFGPQRSVAWRVLDAQYFGVAQRRRRVFVVASARTDFDPAAVLFESEGVRRDTAPSRETVEGVAGTITARFGISRNNQEECVAAPTYLGNAEGGAKEVPFLTCHNTGGTAGISNQTPLVGVTFMADDYKDGGYEECDTARPLTTGADRTRAAPIATVAFTTEQTPKFNDECALTLTKQSPSGGGQIQSVMTAMQVRRLTPVECERLQGFPDNYTAIPWRGKSAEQCPDGPRYKALGNSWAVPVVRWIGWRMFFIGGLQ